MTDSLIHEIQLNIEKFPYFRVIYHKGEITYLP